MNPADENRLLSEMRDNLRRADDELQRMEGEPARYKKGLILRVGQLKHGIETLERQLLARNARQNDIRDSVEVQAYIEQNKRLRDMKTQKRYSEADVEILLEQIDETWAAMSDKQRACIKAMQQKGWTPR